MLFAQIIPITVLVIASIMMIEAAGSVDESTMSRLEGSLWEKNYQNFRVWYLLVHFSEHHILIYKDVLNIFTIAY